ncbi:unnamed protein product [Allacma fusca]|uniref:G-protein coupled receptors family 1 profile domain-containing protein n=1 Tax=Allacma fusca TaxID=39272 RepID=A0A8J2PT63_9HEXA|nr:unnamed protein product [Allacma fusca]
MEEFALEVLIHTHRNAVESGNSVGTDEILNERLYPYRHSSWAITILVIAYLIVLFVGVVGNSIVIVIVVKTPRMRTVTNFFITNLAFADLLVLVVCLPPTLISNVYVPWILGWFLCKTVPYIQGVTVCASVYSLVAISLDRFLAIWFPLRCQITKRKARVLIGLIWLWATVLALPWLVFFDLTAVDPLHPTVQFCVETWPTKASGDIYFFVVNLLLFYILPLGIISLCYFFIWLRVWRRHVPNDSGLSRTEMIHQKAKVGVLKMLLVVVFVFSICWLPLYIIFTRVKLFEEPLTSDEEFIIGLATPLAQWMGSSNSCIKPILYAFLNVKFRRALFTLLCGHSWNRNPTPHYDKTNVLSMKKLHSQVVTTVKLHTSSYEVTEL